MMNCVLNVLNREMGHKVDQRFNLCDSALNKTSLCYEYLFSDSLEIGAPPLALSLNDSLICSANDGGDVCLINKFNLREVKQWTAHNNAIFDIKWRNGYQNQLGTASGDKSIVIWDIDKAKSVENLEMAHNGSIKSIDFQDSNVFASGARDGLIKIWDMRCSRGGSVMVLENAHLSRLPSAKSSPKSRSHKTTPLSSVTCVLFHPLNQNLYSSGANDGTIKVWDLRKCRKNKFNKNTSIPVKELYQSMKKGSPAHGFTNLTFTPNYKLFASCSDHKIYGFEGNTSLPTISCAGLQVNNFTRISALNNNYLVSGSVNSRAFIWSIDWKSKSNRKVWPICSLPHSEDEVTAVICDSSSYSIYTCCDDQRIRKWSLFNSNPNLEKTIKSEPFVVKESVIEVVQEVNHSVITPNANNLPFSSLTNWLENSGKQKNSTPSQSNPKRIRLTQSTPTNKRLSKENIKNKSSKRQLFVPKSKKISDYFTP